MHPEKSPGDDGLNTSFYQIYWSIVGSDVVLTFFSTRDLQPGINCTVICLIPKIKQPQHVTGLRGILSKVMANQLKGCLSKIISIN